MSGGLDRRSFFGLGAGALAASLLAACASDGHSVGDDPGTTSRPANPGIGSSTTMTPGAAAPPAALTAADFDGIGTCRLLPEKTAGPFPLDRQLDRRDVTEGLPGRPLRLGLRVVDARCEPVAASVEIWQCDATGDYSAFQDGGGGKDAATGTTFLRGTQTAGSDGIVEFASIYPGWYRGRAVHIHLRVHHDDETILTSQLFFPDDYTDEVYRAAPYARFGTPDTRNADDGIAGDPGTEGTLLAVRAAETGRGAGTLALVNLGVAA